MAEPFISEIRMMAFNFPPRGWAFCDGQALSIMQNQALFALIGTMYGGNGTTQFKLPDLRGRAPVHRGEGHDQGAAGGEAAHTLTMAEVPGMHTHAAHGTSGAATERSPADALLATGPTMYRSPRSDTEPTTLSMDAVAASGGEPHPNMQPYLAVPFCIALEGVFPSRQ